MSREHRHNTTRRAVLRGAAALPPGFVFARGGTARAQTQSGVRGREGEVVTLKLGSSQPTHTENAHSEPPRVSRRRFGVCYAAAGVSPSAA